MIAAIDCDLHKLYCVLENGKSCRGTTCKEIFDFLTLPPACVNTVLFEIASPVDYTSEKGAAVAYMKRRWTIFNIFAATYLALELGRIADVLVSPSSVWTRGFDVKTRHKIAGCKQKQKDLRECEAMLFSFRYRPQDWEKFSKHIEAI